jgi:site-specific recombinase XerD
MSNEEKNRIDEITDEQWNSVNKENRKIVDEFLRESIQLSPQTLKQYKSALKIYFHWIKNNADDKVFHQIKARDFMLYQNYLIRNGLSSSAVKFKRSAVSSLNNYIILYYGDDYPHFRQYITKAIATPPPLFVHDKEPLTLEEYESLCAELERQEMYQQLAYIRVSFATGARRAEIRQLLKEITSYEPKIVTSEKGEVKTYFTHPIRCKGRGPQGKVRKLQFDEKAMNAIKKWLEIRGEDDCPYVFVTKRNGLWKQAGETLFNSWSDTYFSKIVGRRFHPHLLRESRATTLVVEQGKDIKSAQKLLDHKSSTTTEIYVIRKDEEDADDAFI